jgi:type II secretory pathway predicted ATPase ExeA
MPEFLMDADRPITAAGEDLLERGPLVEQLASWISSAPDEDGFVLGLTGAWGSGKTSILRLLAQRLHDEATVIWFEPWLFSEADELITRFFEEIAGQLAGRKNRRLKKLGTRMAEYGAALSPAAGLVMGPAGQLMAAPKQLASLRKMSASEKRDELRAALLERSHRIVVLIDDINRLDAREVKEVLRLVKLVADLPGVVHVLSYDRRRIETALTQAGHENGRAYLEKIVQASMIVPPVSKDRLRAMTLEWLQQAIGERPLEAFDVTAWSNLVDEGIDGYLKTLRDGRRLANVAPSALDLCAGEVASMDVVALEALRVFDPDTHEALPGIAHILASGSRGLDFRGREQVDAEEREAISALLNASSNPDASRKILRELFPAAGHLFGGSRHAPDTSWRDAKRVASRPVLMRYLHLTLATSEVASATVDQAVAALTDGPELQALVDQVEDERLEDLLARTRARAGEQAEPDAVGCARVALSLIPRIPQGRGFFAVEPTRHVVWFVEDLVKSVEPPESRVAVARRIVEQAPTLSLRLELLYRFRVPIDEPSNEPDLDLLDTAAVQALQDDLASEVDVATAEALAGERDVFFLLTLLGEVSGADAVLKRLQERPVLRKVLESPGTSVRPIADGISLHLEPLIELAGEAILEPLRGIAERDAELDDELRVALMAALSSMAED